MVLMSWLSRGIVRLVDDSYRRQQMQITGLAGETIDDAQHWQPYGFASVPLSGAECLLADDIVLCVSDRRYRLRNMGNGDVQIHDHRGQSVTLTSGGIEVTADTVTVTAGTVNLGGSAATAGVVCAGPTFVCPINPLSGHLVGSTTTRSLP